MLRNKKVTKKSQNLGKRIKKLRMSKDITQEKLAEKVGVSLGWISRIERGVVIANMELLSKIARALNVKVKDLIPF